jgi:hypothetical protein
MALGQSRPIDHFWRVLIALLPIVSIGRMSHAVEKASEQVSPFYGSLSRGTPIEVPPFHGLEPKLGFSYSSEGRNGVLGVGWNLSGISTIERVNAGLGTPRWDETDVYLMDGQQLIPCGGIASPSCTAGGSHATKDETYLKILFNSGANTWTVWGRDGTRTVFSPTLQPGEGHTLRWGQTSTIDTKGNTVTTTWTCQFGEECYPAAISYNGYSVTFIHEARPDTLSQAAGDILVKTLYRLRSVFVMLGSTPIRAYRLLYTTSPLTGRSLLASIEQFGKDVLAGGTPLPPQTFTYQDDLLGKGFYAISGDPPTPPATSENVVWTNLVNAQANGNSVSKTNIPSAWDAGAASTRALVAGDGYVEIDTVIGIHTIVGFSNGDGDANPGEIDFALYQNNNDGRLYVWENGAQFGPFGAQLQAGEKLRVEVQGGHVLYKQGATVLRDVERRLVYPLLVDASIYTSSGTVSNAVLHGSLGYVSHWCGGVLLTGDVNGDGRTDQLCHKGAEGTLQVALATASGFAAATTWTSALSVPQITTGDFNSDGKTDVAYVNDGNGDFSVSLSTGTSFPAPSF